MAASSRDLSLATDAPLEAMDAAFDGIAILDRGGRYRYMNAAHAALYGYDAPEELIGKTWHSLYGRDVRRDFEARYLPELAARGMWRGEVEGQRRDGGRVHVEVSLTALENGSLVCVCRDVGERKRAAESLELYEHMVASTNTPMSFVDGDYRFRVVNQAFVDLCGTTVESAVGRRVADLLGEEYFATVIEPELDRCLAGERVHSRRWMNLVEGDPRCMDIDFDPYRDRDGVVRGVVWSLRDVSDRIRAEDALRESESRFRNLVEGSGQGVIIHRDHVPIYVNQAAADIFGYDSPEELTALGELHALEARYEHARLRAYSAARRAGGEAPSQYEFDGLRKDGSTVNLINSARVVTWYGEAAIQSTLIDITGRKRVEAALRNSRETLRAVIDAVPAMINAKDTEHRFIFMNEYQANLYGVSVKNAVGKTVRELVDPVRGAYTQKLDRQVLDSGEPIPSFEEPFVDRDGAERTLLTTIVPIPADDPWVVTIALDITQRKRAAEEREKLIAELEASNAELERFGYTVSHDLKSPLITIRGYVGHLGRDLAAGDGERCAQDLAQIEAAAERMQVLLEDMLELSRLGRVTNAPEPVALGEIVRDALVVLEGPIARTGAEVRVAPDLPVVDVDRPCMAQVVRNLIDNALKFRSPGTPPLVEVGVRENGRIPICYVRDNGRGIDPEHHDAVFGLFERLGHDVEGTGIGLAMVRRIIELHGGEVWVESEGDGHGTAVCFTLPRPSAGEGHSR